MRADGVMRGKSPKNSENKMLIGAAKKANHYVKKASFCCIFLLRKVK
jgi:hypothetical protein